MESASAPEMVTNDAQLGFPVGKQEGLAGAVAELQNLSTTSGLEPDNSDHPAEMDTQETSMVSTDEGCGNSSSISIASVVSLTGGNLPDLQELGLIEAARTKVVEVVQQPNVCENTETVNSNESIDEPQLSIDEVAQNCVEQSEENSCAMEMAIVDVRSLNDETDKCFTENSVNSSIGMKDTRDIFTESSNNYNVCSETYTNTSITNTGSSKVLLHESEVTETEQDGIDLPNGSVSEPYKNVANGNETDVEETLMITDVRSLSEDRSSDTEVVKMTDTSAGIIQSTKSIKVNNKIRLDPVTGEIIEEREETESEEVEKHLEQQSSEEQTEIQRAFGEGVTDSAVNETVDSASAEAGISGEAAVMGSSCGGSSTSPSMSISASEPTALSGSATVKSAAEQVVPPIIQLSSTDINLQNVESVNNAETASKATKTRTGQLSTAGASEHSTATDLPVISNIFSIKQEPTNDGSYGVMPANNKMEGSPPNSNRASIANVINKLHGKKVNPLTVETTKAKTLKMIPVSDPAILRQWTNSSSMNHGGQPSKSSHVHFVYTSMPSPIHTLPSALQKRVVLNTPDGGQKLVITNGQVRIISPPTLNSSKSVNIAKQTADLTPHTVKVITYPPSNTSQALTIQKQAADLPIQAVKVLRYPSSKAGGESRHKLILPRGQPVVTISAANKPVATVTSSIPAVATSTSKSTCKKQNTKEAQKAGKPATNIDTDGYINIQTVGVDKVTELIARKNPIPLYKPPRVPDNLRESTAERKVYPCYECGDTYYFENSLRIHLTRCSMRLQYYCCKCCKHLKFTNKCQLLSHLRSHLHIEKSQAVPIHIKSDSVQIKTVYDEIGKDKDFQWYDEKKVEFGKNYDSCIVCGLNYNGDQERLEHFKQCTVTVPYHCDICSMNMTNNCGLKLHTNLHRLVENGRVNDDMICPECGVNFGFTDTDKFYEHLTIQCFHSSRLWIWQCPKCMEKYCSQHEVKQHLLTRLENYYKCGDCPMALKSLGSFISHYKQKHGQISDPNRHVKMIYRCHFCDTLIDDRGFLLSHIQKHMASYKYKGNMAFYCSHCQEFFSTRTQMSNHFNSSHADFVCETRHCGVCNLTFDNAVVHFLHNAQMHKIKVHTEEVQFCKCGLVCTSEKMLSEHACLLDVAIDKSIVVENANSLDVVKEDIGEIAIWGDREATEAAKREGHTVVKRVAQIKEFKCPMCLMIFYSNAGRTTHIKMHHRSRKEYICVSCDRMDFKDYFDLRNHEILCIAQSKKIQTPQKNGRAVKDKKKSEKPAQDIKPDEDDGDHESDVETDKNFGKVRLNLKGVNQEKRFIDKGETFKCEKCSQVFSRRSKLNEHMDAEHSLHSCHLCGLMYESLSRLKMHLYVFHKGKKPVYYCWVCRSRKIEKCYTEVSSLERHLCQKHRIKTLDKCKLVAEWPGEDMKGVSPEPQILKSLQTGDTPEKEPPFKKLKVEGESVFKCAKCAFTCENKEEFREHITRHTTENTVQCMECGLCFTVFPSLQRHLFMVHKIRDFKSYVTENSIEEPKEMETLDLIEREPEVSPKPVEPESEEEETGNPMECKVCYKEFESEHGLRQHMRVHGMAFIRKSRRRIASKVAQAKEAEEDVKVDSSDGDKTTDNIVEEEDIGEPNTKKARTQSSGSDAECGVTENTTVSDRGQTQESDATLKAEAGEGLKIKISLGESNEKVS